MTLKHPPIFDLLPSLAEPWVSLLARPTAVRHLADFGREIGHSNLWVKDDGMSGNLFGGNKVRSLEFLLGEVTHRQKRKLVTFGGIESNLALAVAVYCQAQDIRAHLFLTNLSRTTVEATKRRIEVLQSLGACTTIVSRIGCWAGSFDARHLGLQEKIWTHSTFVPAGATFTSGCIGHTDAAIELTTQIKNGDLPSPTEIFVPLGTGGTAAGLHAGFLLTHQRARVVGVDVGGGASRRSIVRLARRTLQRVGAAKDAFDGLGANERLKVLNGYEGAGYGIKAALADLCAQLLLETEGISLDSTYGAKALWAFSEFAKRDQSGQPLLFWNTSNRRRGPWSIMCQNAI